MTLKFGKLSLEPFILEYRDKGLFQDPADKSALIRSHGILNEVIWKVYLRKVYSAEQ